jgi:hypothetical protein
VGVNSPSVIWLTGSNIAVTVTPIVFDCMVLSCAACSVCARLQSPNSRGSALALLRTAALDPVKPPYARCRQLRFCYPTIEVVPTWSDGIRTLMFQRVLGRRAPNTLKDIAHVAKCNQNQFAAKRLSLG